MYPSATPATNAMAAGQGAIVVPNYVANLATLGNAPVAFSQPAFTVGIENDVLLAAKAEHPNAGALLADYILSQAYFIASNDPSTGRVPLQNSSKLPSQYQAPNESNAAHLKQVLQLLGL